MFLVGSGKLYLWGKAISGLITWDTPTHVISTSHIHLIWRLIYVWSLVVIKVKVTFRVSWLISTWSCRVGLNIFITVRKLIVVIVILLGYFIEGTWSLLIASLEWLLLLVIPTATLVHVIELRIHLVLLMIMVSLVLKLIWWLEYVTESINLMLVVRVLIEYWLHGI